jgi:excisionase family DNA binding protein
MDLADSLEKRATALTVSDVASLLNISERQVYKLAADGRIPCLKLETRSVSIRLPSRPGCGKRSHRHPWILNRKPGPDAPNLIPKYGQEPPRIVCRGKGMIFVIAGTGHCQGGESEGKGTVYVVPVLTAVNAIARSRWCPKHCSGNLMGCSSAGTGLVNTTTDPCWSTSRRRVSPK